MLFFGLAALSDLQAGNKAESTLNRCKDLLFSVFAFPVGTVRNTKHFHTLLTIKKELCYTLTPCSVFFL